MDNILNFAPLLWQIFQHDLIHKDRKNCTELKTQREKFISAFKFFIFGLNIANLMLYSCICIANIYTEPLDISILSFYAIIFANSQIAFVKYFLIFRNRQKIQEIMKKLPAFYSIMDEQDFKVSQQLRWCRVPFLMNSFTIFGGVFISLLTPFDENIYFNTIRFPFMSNAVVYYSVNIWIRVMIIVAQLITVINESIAYGLIIILTVEFQKLDHLILEFKAKLLERSRKAAKLKNILPENRETSSTIQDLTSKVKEIVDQHSQLLEIRNELENIFAPAFLVNYLCGTICLLMSEILTLVINNPVDGVAFLSGGVSQTLIFFIQCYYCQQLKEACLSVSDAIYDCKWEEIEDVKVKKHLLMILMRSQKSKTLTCWKFAENSFSLFGSVS